MLWSKQHVEEWLPLGFRAELELYALNNEEGHVVESKYENN